MSREYNIRSPVYDSYNIEVGVTDFNTPLGLAPETGRRSHFFGRNNNKNQNRYTSSSGSRKSKRSHKSVQSLPTRIVATPTTPVRGREPVWQRPDLRSPDRYYDTNDEYNRRSRSASRGRSNSVERRRTSRSRSASRGRSKSESRGSKPRTSYSDLFEMNGQGPPSSARYYSGDNSVQSKYSRARSVSPSMLAGRRSSRHDGYGQYEHGNRKSRGSRGSSRGRGGRERNSRSESPRKPRNSVFNFSNTNTRSSNRRHERTWRERLSPNSVWSQAYTTQSAAQRSYDNRERIRFAGRQRSEHSEKVGDYRCRTMMMDDGTVYGYELGRSDYSIGSKGSTRSTASSSNLYSATRRNRPIVAIAIVFSTILVLLVVAAVIYIVGIQNTPFNFFGGSGGGNNNNTVTEFPSMAPGKDNGPISIYKNFISEFPSASPTKTPIPTLAPTKKPTRSPTKQPTRSPTKAPTAFPTRSPSVSPSSAPSSAPSFGPDPKCEMGILSSLFCCHPSCGACGGDNCEFFEGGGDNCCTKNILMSFRDCSVVGPPCVVTDI